MMNLAVVHYHLNRGGVTRVIQNQLTALDAALGEADPWHVALLYGGRHEGWNEDLPNVLKRVRLTLRKVPALDYDEEGGSAEVGPQLAASLRQLGFAPQETVLHVHNHALGKNVHLPGALGQLAQDGFPLLLQIHDFAEDFRPANYRRLRDALICAAPSRQAASALAALLYPQSPQIHYALINGRDHGILRSAGVAEETLHWLPNPIPERDHLPPASWARRRLAEKLGVAEHQRLLLYPVRCIRRKNLGEALLYAALAPPDTVVGLTLPPRNPAEVPVYQAWKRLAGELDLRCRFELGVRGVLTFAENLAAADMFCTTSVAEGFGMVFLESWLAGRPLLGRNLPEITCDFTKLGIRLDWLGPQLRVPVEWTGVDTFRRTILAAFRRTLEAYGCDEPENLPELLRARTQDGLVDFADLDETLQQQVLRTVCRDEQSRRHVLRCNGWLERALSIRRDEVGEVIAANARAIRKHLALVPMGRRLLDVYGQVAASPRAHRTQPLPGAERIAEQFLDFARFRPLRS